ncbi:tryptophan synthase subunit beta [Candidatus Peregrinibacteria bacterium]|nr:tryptophan synthase subunit beta [Candidatus Peregrinibacteria bacterium]
MNRHFGKFGGMYVSELLAPILLEVADEFEKTIRDKNFFIELRRLQKEFLGRPTPLYFARRLSEKYGFRIYLKREDLVHGGAHKTNNTIGQGLLAKRMKKKELIAETGAGQHGVAVAMTGALFGMPVKIFMGEKDMARQAQNVDRMKMFGAEVIGVSGGSQSLKEAINSALRYWVSCVEKTYYVFGTVAGPHPFPKMVRFFQEIIGKETRRQIFKAEGRLPDYVFACVGGGSNAIGIFSAFLKDKSVRLLGAEAGGKGVKSDLHGATLSKGSIGCLHGAMSYVLQNEDGQICEAHSISAGLDYPGVGPEHAFLKENGRAKYIPVNDNEAIASFLEVTKTEGIMPALESSHALALLPKLRAKKGSIIVINLSGRGDKDISVVRSAINAQQPFAT